MVRNENTIEEESFMLQIDEVLDNSKLIKKQSFDLPHYIQSKNGKGKQETSIKDYYSLYYDQLIKIFEDFSDFKMTSYQNSSL